MLDGLLDLDTGRVHQDVELAAFLVDPRHRGFRIILGRHIEFHEPAVISRCRQRSGFRQISGEDRRPFTLEPGADGAPNSPTAARHQRNFPR